MISSFFKTAWRSLWKRKSFSFLNIAGLAIGIATSLLLFLAIRNELNFDRYHAKKDRIYRVVTYQENKSNGEINNPRGTVPAPLPFALAADFPDFEKVASIWNLGQAQIYVLPKGASEEKQFKQNSGLFWTSETVFDLFDVKWIDGNAAELANPNTVVLGETLARKFFGDPHAAMGQTFQLWSFRVPLKVVGVFKDLPPNTDLPMEMGASAVTLKNLTPEIFTSPDAWGFVTSNNECFFLTKKPEEVNNLNKRLDAFAKKYFREDPAFTWKLGVQPLVSMHLDERYGKFRNDALSKKELYSLGLIGIFLLLVACINFINLSTAQSVTRAKEIGVRKVLGGHRGQLMGQFMKETAMICFFSMMLGLLIAAACLPLLNGVMHKGISLRDLFQPTCILFLLLTGIVVTLLSGIYPAMVLAGFKPVAVLKSKVNPRIAGGISLRRALVVFQFVIAQLLIIGTLVVAKQMNFFRNRPMGFEKESIVLVNLPSDSALKVRYPSLKGLMDQVPGVLSTSLCMDAPSDAWSWSTDFTYDNDVLKKDFPIDGQFADTGYFRTFGIPVVAGRAPFASDTAREVVVNQALVRKLGLHSPEEIIGRSIQFNGWDSKLTIVGVIGDYNNRSLRDVVRPLAITTIYNAYEWLALRMDQRNMSSNLEAVHELFSSFYPTYMFDRVFFDERIEGYYRNEAVTEKLFKIFSVLAILISCLGLFGLISFMAIQKTREVGIRKVLGASVQRIVYLFSKEFTILIALAFLVSAPIAYYLMQKWLSGFYYHTRIGWLVFASAFAGSLFIAWLAVGYKSIRAALVNPVDSLKSE